MKIVAGFLLLALVTLCVPHTALAAGTTHYQRLFYYRDGPLAKKSFFAHPSSIDIFAPQTYSFDDSGALSGTVDADLLAFAKKHAIKVMPLVTNDSFTQSSYKAILDSTTTQASAINALVLEAQNRGYMGWQIDFEQMDASYRDKFSDFVKNAALALHQHNLKLSVSVVAKISDTPSDYPHTLWQDLIGAYDYDALAASTDFVSVMSYDDPYSTGPVTGYDWLTKVLTYSLAHIPAKKLSLGLAFYYWQWNTTTGKRIGIGGNEGLDAAIKKHYVSYHYSLTEHAPYLTYWKNAQQYTIWYENARSIGVKVSLVQKYKLYGISAWALGLELPSVYSSLR